MWKSYRNKWWQQYSQSVWADRTCLGFLSLVISTLSAITIFTAFWFFPLLGFAKIAIEFGHVPGYLAAGIAIAVAIFMAIMQFLVLNFTKFGEQLLTKIALKIECTIFRALSQSYVIGSPVVKIVDTSESFVSHTPPVPTDPPRKYLA